MNEPSEWILDGMPVGIWVARAPDGQVTYANPAFQEILGMNAVSDSRITDAPATYGIFDRAGRPFPLERLPFSQALAHGRPVVVDDIVIHRGDGTRVNIRATGVPIRDAAGAITHVIVSFLDITREVRAELERETFEARLHLAADHAPIIIWSTDRNGVVLHSEGAGLAALGVRAGELVGQSAFEMYKNEPPVLDALRRALAGESFWTDVKIGEAYLNTWMAPMRDAGGEIIGVLGLTNDVTALRRLQAATIQADRLHAMGTLAASVAHEINNPLTYVLGGLAGLERRLEVLREKTETDDSCQTVLVRLAEELGLVRMGVDRIATVARDLKAFSRPDDTRLEPVDVRGVVSSVLKLTRKDVEARAQLRLDLGEVPPVAGNEARLVQVVMNLVVNASQSLAQGRPDRDEISITTRVEKGRVVLEVADSGPGVPPADRERIFEPFVTTKPVGEGTGLGLFVCRRLVQGLGGDISVHDRPAGGALFRVQLPVSDRPAAPRESTPAKPVAAGRVLVIDDDPLVCGALVGQLEDDGIRAEAILDPHHGLRVLLGAEPYDLAYCDLMMAGLTGMDIAHEVEAQAPERLSRIVFMTGGAFVPRASSFVADHLDSCVEKPFDVVGETRRRLADVTRPA